MPVPTTFADLSTTIASNSPAGSDNVFPDLDNYIRALAGMLASVSANSGNGWTSPYLALAGGTVSGSTTFSGAVTLSGSVSGAALTNYLAAPAAIGGTTPAAGAFTTLSASSTVSGAGFSTYLASPPAIGGTAAAAGSFTTLSASGAVTLSGGTANGVLYLNGSKVATSGSALTFDGTNFATTGTASATKLIPTGGSATGNGMYLPAANTLAWSNNGAETMRLDSSGNLGVNTNNPSAYGGKLNVYSGDIVIADASTSSGASAPRIGSSAQALVFKTNSGGGSASEVGRFDGSGNLLVGTTSSSLTNSNSIIALPSAGGFYIQHANGAASGTIYEGYAYNGTAIGTITQNGTTGVLYNTTSDRRLKQNIVPAPSASDVIDAIQIVSHGWKAAPDERVTYGVIAQDLHAVVPQAVSVGDDGEEIERTWGVDYSKLVPMLIKEMQSLRARVAQLERQP